MYSLLQKLFGKKTRTARASSPRRSRKRVVLQVEALEDRVVPVIGNAVFAANNYSGVGFVQNSEGTARGSCTLLADGIHVLTAAHVVTQDTPGGGHSGFDQTVGAKVVFACYTYNAGFNKWTAMDNTQSVAIDVVAGVVPDDWAREGVGGVRSDIAVLTLAQPAPNWVTRYNVNRQTNEVGQVMRLVGYGNTGTGETGATSPAGTKYYGFNRVDEIHMAGYTAANGSDQLGGEMLQMQLDPSSPNPGVLNEVLNAPGDSGGPLFAGTLIAGVASTASDTTFEIYGTKGWYTRVSSWANWIDRQMGQSHVLVVDATQHAFGYSLDGRSNYTVDINAVWDNGEVKIMVNGGLYDEARAADIQSIIIRGSAVPTTITVDSALAGRVSADRPYTVVFDVSRQPGGTSGNRHSVQVGTAGSYEDFYLDGHLLDHVPTANVPALSIIGSSAGDDITLFGAVPTGGVTVHTNRSGNPPAATPLAPYTLTIDDSAASAVENIRIAQQQVTLTSVGKIARVSFNQIYIHGLTVEAGTPSDGRGNSIVVENTPSPLLGTTPFSLYCGGGSDDVQIQAISGPTSINGQDGQDTVTVGNNNSLAGIRYSLGVTNDHGSTQLNILAVADSGNHTVELNASGLGNYITGLAPVPILYGFTGIRGVSIETGAGNDTINVRRAPVSTRILTGAGRDTVNVDGVNANTLLYIDTGVGRNTVDIGAAHGLNAIQGQVQVRADGGSNTLYIDDRAQTFAATYTLYGDEFQAEGSAPMLFADVQTLLIWGGQGEADGAFSPAGNTFNILGTAPAPTYTTLFAGDRASVNVQATTGSLFVNFADSDLASVNIGGPEHGLENIQGDVWVAGGSGMSLTVDDSGSTDAQTVTIDQDGLSRSGAAAIHYLYAGDFPLYFQGGSGGNTINVLGKRGNLTLLSGTGTDTITIGSAAGTLSNLGHFIINGQGGGDALYLLDQGEAVGQTYDFFTISNLPDYSDIPVFTTTGTTIVLAQLDAGAVTASTLATLVLNCGSGANTVNLQTTPAVTAVTINGSGADTLVINDQGTMADRTFTLNNGSVSWDGGSVTSSGVTSLTLNAGAGTNTFDVRGTLAGTTTTLNGGTGFNEFVVQDPSLTMDGLQGTLALHGQPGSLSFAVLYDYFNPVGQTYTFTVGLVTRTGIAPISYDGLGEIILGASLAGGNMINVQSNAADVYLALDVGSSDTVYLGKPQEDGSGTATLAEIGGSVGVNAWGQAPTVILDNTADPSVHDVTAGLDAYGVYLDGLAPARFYFNVDPADQVQVQSGGDVNGLDAFFALMAQGVPN